MEWREIKGYKYPYRISDQGEVQQYKNEAATALSTLQAENEKLRAELKQAKRERDAIWRTWNKRLCRMGGIYPV